VNLEFSAPRIQCTPNSLHPDHQQPLSDRHSVIVFLRCYSKALVNRYINTIHHSFHTNWVVSLSPSTPPTLLKSGRIVSLRKVLAGSSSYDDSSECRFSLTLSFHLIGKSETQSNMEKSRPTVSKSFMP